MCIRDRGTVEQRIFSALRHLIALRKEIPAFADLNNRELHAIDNPHMFVYSRFDPMRSSPRVLVAANFSSTAQALPLEPLRRQGFFVRGSAWDISTQETLHCEGGEVTPVSYTHLVFPETAPGNFTWDEAKGKWVMTVFNNYQWDLNYRNPAVFIEMLDIIF